MTHMVVPDLDHLRKWIGNSEEATDMVTARLVQGLRAILLLEGSDPAFGDAAPLSAHWCYLLTLVPKSQGFLPPVPMQQRLWAGGKTEFLGVLRVGDQVTRRSEITDIELKNGRSGALCFVTVRHSYSTSQGIVTVDDQHFVYRNPAPAGGSAPPPAPSALPEADHVKPMHADAEMIFRYSALTFNGFRVHYDAEYAKGVEGYPGLMVHGPLQAALLLEYALELSAGRAPASFSHRSLNLLFEGDFTLNAKSSSDGLELWTTSPSGVICMKAHAHWKDEARA